MNPILSICIPIYNAENTLERCLRPFLGAEDAEIIAVNDGSTDDTLEKLREYEKRYSNIKVFTQDDLGVSNARNRAIRNATGEYLTFVDADDWLDRESLDLLKIIKNSHNPDLIQFGVVSEFEGWNRKKDLLYTQSHLLNNREKKRLLHLVIGGFDEQDMENTHFGLASCKFYKHSVVKDIFFDEYAVGEDTLYAVEAMKKAESVYYLSGYFYHYTSNEGSRSHSIMKDIVLRSVKMLEKMKELLETEISTDSFLCDGYYNRAAYMFHWCLLALGYYSIEEKNYRTAILSEIFSHKVYFELLDHIHEIHTNKLDMLILKFVKEGKMEEAVKWRIQR